jgi:hypothetical protein
MGERLPPQPPHDTYPRGGHSFVANTYPRLGVFKADRYEADAQLRSGYSTDECNMRVFPRSECVGAFIRPYVVCRTST